MELPDQHPIKAMKINSFFMVRIPFVVFIPVSFTIPSP
jgi:hypothetical protein